MRHAFRATRNKDIIIDFYRTFSLYTFVSISGYLLDVKFIRLEDRENVKFCNS